MGEKNKRAKVASIKVGVGPINCLSIYLPFYAQPTDHRPENEYCAALSGGGKENPAERQQEQKCSLRPVVLRLLVYFGMFSS